ncbi:hypothetical protein [Amycolatopsis sp. NPDC059021]|uniref:hypothetical protein n=1 Tax=Amycolatopsis sp. NPDC059021 TaxID=3346704 RepID=UPI003671C63A
MSDEPAIDEYLELRRLTRHSYHEWLFGRVPAAYGAGAMVVGVCVWPFSQYMDSLQVVSADEVLALRWDPGRGIVWKRTGSLRELVDLLLEFPPPRPRPVSADVKDSALDAS